MIDMDERIQWGDAELLALTRSTSFATPAGDWSDSRGHLLLFYHIAKWVNWPEPETPQAIRRPLVLEIGVREGPSSLALLTAMRETGGKLISLECDAEVAAVARQVVERAGLMPWWQLEVARSEDYAASVTDPLDVLVIDGDHSEKQVRLDVEHYAHKVRPNGFILFHDYWSDAGCRQQPVSPPFPSDVSVVVEELRATGDYEVLVMPWSFGLAVCRKLR